MKCKKHLSIYFVIIEYGELQPYSRTILCKECAFAEITKFEYSLLFPLYRFVPVSLEPLAALRQ